MCAHVCTFFSLKSTYRSHTVGQLSIYCSLNLRYYLLISFNLHSLFFSHLTASEKESKGGKRCIYSFFYLTTGQFGIELSQLDAKLLRGKLLRRRQNWFIIIKITNKWMNAWLVDSYNLECWMRGKKLVLCVVHCLRLIRSKCDQTTTMVVAVAAAVITP